MNNTYPLVSVIIPAYNRADVISRAINSVLAQTLQNFEIIVIDDGSEPPIRKIKNNKISLIRHHENKGAAAARNTGIRAARGKLIAFLDSDDEWLPDKLQKQVAFLEKNPSVDACATAHYLSFPPKRTVLHIPTRPNSWKKRLLLGCDIGPGTTLMVRKSCFEKVGTFDTSFPRLEDLDWLMRFVNHFEIEILNTPLAMVYRHGFPSAKLIEISNTLLIKKHRDAFENFGIFYGRKARAKRWLEVALSYYREKHYSKGTCYLVKGITTNPFQRFGYYLLILDQILGTQLEPWSMTRKQQISKVISYVKKTNDEN